MPWILLVYYSRTWTTKKVAESIEDFLKCDTEEVIDKKRRRWFFWFLIANRDAAKRRLTEIQDTKFDPKNYETVIIGTPVRNFTMSCAIRTYLEQHKQQLPKRLIFFCTQSSGWGENTFQEMANICRVTPLGKLCIENKDVSNISFEKKIRDFFTETINRLIYDIKI